MRFRDAVHLDTGPFYARLPEQGRIFRALGYLGVAMAIRSAGDPRALWGLVIFLLVAWVYAWKRTVGTLWRSSLVAALVACAVILTYHRLAEPAAAPVDAQEAHP
jgi:hypothetical protein